ncbi:unnamed protein product [Rangifer tarandus platyrhynchus]|uniref:Uncharacterized protein n=1 Tax=Rangifer tarandus platyrhynchus TaxID=3082113 RepID=A0AC59ZFG1_RANTA
MALSGDLKVHLQCCLWSSVMPCPGSEGAASRGSLSLWADAPPPSADLPPGSRLSLGPLSARGAKRGMSANECPLLYDPGAGARLRGHPTASVSDTPASPKALGVST